MFADAAQRGYATAVTSSPSESTLLPPGPRGLLRPAHALIFHPIESLDKWRARFGPTFTVNRLGTKIVFTCQPELIQQVFAVSDPDVFSTSTPASFDVVFGPDSLFTITGARHLSERKLMTPAFHGERLQDWAEAMAAATRRAFGRSGETRAFERLQEVTLDIIVRVIFGVDDPARIREFSEALLEMMNSIRPGLLFFRLLQRPWLGIRPYARFHRANAKVQALLLDQIARTRSDLDGRTDVLADLLRARYDDGSPMTDSAVCDHLRTLLLAGHETTAVTLAWAIYYVLRDEQVLARVRAELASLGDDPNPTELTRLPYLGAAIDETLRIRPFSAESCRVLTRPLQIGEWRLPAGAAIAPSPVLTHLDPAIWPEPHTFRPERFLDNSRPRPSVYFPFGGGTRRCIGATFARFESRVILGTLLREHQIELLDRDVQWVRGPGTLQPRGGVRIRLS